MGQNSGEGTLSQVFLDVSRVSYNFFIASTSLNIRAEAVLSIENPVLLHTLLNTFCSSVEVYEKSETRNRQMQVRALLYTKHKDKPTPPKHNLLVFQVKRKTTRY